MSEQVIIEDIENISVSDSILSSPEKVSKFIINCNDSLKILHVNIRSINCNFDSLLVLLKRINVKIDIIILSECWLSVCPVTPTLHGYASFRSNYSNQNEGVIAYIRDYLDFTVVEPAFNDANCLLIKIPNKLCLVALYRSPAYKNTANFVASLDLVLKSLNEFPSTIIMGDININIKPEGTDPNCDDYLNLLASYGLLPGHLFATREQNCLDHVMLRGNQKSTTIVFESPLTDHQPVFLCTSFKSTATKSNRTIKRINEAAVITDLENTDFTSLLKTSDPDTVAESLVNTLSNIIINNTETVKISSKNKIIKPWITPGLLRCIRNRDKLYLKSTKSPTNQTLKTIFTRYKNYCNNLLKKVKKTFEQNELEKAKGDPKAMWQTIKKIANINIKSAPSNELLKLSDNVLNSVNIVNKFFSGVGRNLASKIEALKIEGDPAFKILNNPCPNSMGMLEVDCEEVEGIILSLKNSSAVGWDGIPTSIIKKGRHVLVPIMCHIFNLCIGKGCFPKVFKKALVHPIHKGGSGDSVNNYRPISVLTVLSKIFEKILNKKLINHLDKNNIISKNQFGFRSGRSTEDAVQGLTEHIVRGLDNGLKTVGIFLDLCKAFDTVSVPLLLSKMEQCGIRGIALDIFTDYLKDRSQRVVIGEHTSDEESISFGVPQGSVLGPTLFLIYINELCDFIIPNCKIITYADDTVLLVQAKSWPEVHQLAELALHNVMIWLSKNLLTLNIEKTKFITFSIRRFSQPPPSFTIIAHRCDNATNRTCSCQNILRTDHIRYLGVIIDSVLSWNQHCTQLISRIRKLIVVFKRLRTAANHDILKMIYFALAQSIISYCIVVWGGCCKSRLLRVERAQRCVLKVMAYKPIIFPTTEIYSYWNVLSVRKLFYINVTLRKHSNTPFDPHYITLRRRHDLVCSLEKHKTVFAGRFYYYISSILYNRINKKLNIYPMTLRECKLAVTTWLLSLSYDDTESLISIIK